MTATDRLADRKAGLRRNLVAAQAELLALVARLAPVDWSRPSPNAGWAARDLLAHLASAEAGFLQQLGRMVAGAGGVPADFDPDRWNAGQLRRRAERSVEELRADLVAAHQQVLALLDEVDEAALERRGRMSSGHEGSVEETFRLLARHKRLHTGQIEAATQ